MNQPLMSPLSRLRKCAADNSELDQRQTIRRCLKRPVQLQDSGGLKLSATMVDISETGCQLQFDGPVSIQVGRIYCIKLEGTEALGAYAIWTHGAKSGFFFSSPLYSAVVEHIAGGAAPLVEQRSAMSTPPGLLKPGRFSTSPPPRLFAVA